MALSADHRSPAISRSDWLHRAAIWGLIPGWVVSLVLHCGLFGGCLMLSQLESCRGDYSGEDGTGFREVGLTARDSLSDSTPAAADATAAENPSQPMEPTVSQAPPTPTAFEGPPAPLSLPTAPLTRPLLGAGPPALGAPALAPPSLSGAGQVVGGVPGSRGAGPSDGAGQAVGQTSLFGVNDSGKKFVYVIDRSFSMDEYGAFAAAKAELITSLSRLTEVQQFQVILYNNEPLLLETRDARYPLFFGTDTQRLLVREQIRSIPPDGGTRHLPALEAALKFNPDVIFFLTDGAEPALSAAEMDALRNLNRQGSRIHCIEFGRGPQLHNARGQAVPNFLSRLADQHSGKYTYRDVKQFTPEP